MKNSHEPEIVGVDFMGEETNKTRDFARELSTIALIRSTRPEFHIRVHAGENGNELDNIKDAIKLGATRIGHGVYGVDEETLRLARENNVIIEFNANSNVALRNIDGTGELPIKQYLNAGVRVTLGTDGHGMYRTSARSEEAVMRSLGLTDEDFAKITRSDQLYLEMMKHPERLRLRPAA
jgi:adenosine deaminase